MSIKKQLLHTLVIWHVMLAYAEAAVVSTLAPAIAAARNTKETSSINTRNVETLCPNILAYIFDGAAPQAGEAAGVYKEYPPLAMNADEMDLNSCIAACCAANNNHTNGNINNNFNSSTNCHVAFVFNQKCYHVRCSTNEGCLPKKIADDKQDVQMVLVQPILENNEQITWTKLLRVKKEKYQAQQQFAEFDEFLNNVHDQRPDERVGPYSDKVSMNVWQAPHKFRLNTRNQVYTFKILFVMAGFFFTTPKSFLP